MDFSSVWRTHLDSCVEFARGDDLHHIKSNSSFVCLIELACLFLSHIPLQLAQCPPTTPPHPTPHLAYN